MYTKPLMNRKKIYPALILIIAMAASCKTFFWKKSETNVPPLVPGSPDRIPEFMVKPGVPEYGLPFSAENIFFRHHLEKLSKKKIWLVTNPSGIGRKPLALFRTLTKIDCTILGFLALEHGIFGVEEDFSHSKDFSLMKTGDGNPDRHADYAALQKSIQMQNWNLYKLSKSELAELLSKADYILFDVGDVGIRCYTYTTILKRILDVLHGDKLPAKLLLIDHANPVGYLGAGGPGLKEGYGSFVGEMPIPLYHGLTIAELANYYQKSFAPGAGLELVLLEKYYRNLVPSDYEIWKPTSPNLPSLEAVVNYQALVFLEGINVSVGRGTSGPFLYVGAPFIDPEKLIEMPQLTKTGVQLTEVYFTPAASVYKGKLCSGIKIRPLPNFKPVHFIFELLKALFTQFPESVHWLGSGRILHVDKLWGSEDLRTAVDKKLDYSAFRSLFEADEEKWKFGLEKWYLY